MILLDANILVIDLGYIRDRQFDENLAFLTHTFAHDIDRGITSQGLLEVVGKRSFNVSKTLVASLPSAVAKKYGLSVIPDPSSHPDYSGCTFDEIVMQMTLKMSLGDAVMAVQIAKFAPTASALITWDAAHFRGKAGSGK